MKWAAAQATFLWEDNLHFMFFFFSLGTQDDGWHLKSITFNHLDTDLWCRSGHARRWAHHFACWDTRGEPCNLLMHPLGDKTSLSSTSLQKSGSHSNYQNTHLDPGGSYAGKQQTKTNTVLWYIWIYNRVNGVLKKNERHLTIKGHTWICGPLVTSSLLYWLHGFGIKQNIIHPVDFFVLQPQKMKSRYKSRKDGHIYIYIIDINCMYIALEV